MVEKKKIVLKQLEGNEFFIQEKAKMMRPSRRFIISGAVVIIIYLISTRLKGIKEITIPIIITTLAIITILKFRLDKELEEAIRKKSGIKRNVYGEEIKSKGLWGLSFGAIIGITLGISLSKYFSMTSIIYPLIMGFGAGLTLGWGIYYLMLELKHNKRIYFYIPRRKK